MYAQERQSSLEIGFLRLVGCQGSREVSRRRAIGADDDLLLYLEICLITFV